VSPGTRSPSTRSPGTRAPALLAGLGHYFPGAPVPNSYFEQLPQLGIDDAWIREHTGVGARHWPDDGGERLADMGAAAARMALADAEIDVGSVDVLIGTSATARPRVNPTAHGNNYMDLSLPVQRLLGLERVVCFDVTAVACAGFLYASQVARSLLWSMDLETALVVCAENPKPILDFRYRNSALFGAGAAAAVWRRTDGPGSVADTVLRADPEHYGAFDIDERDRMVMRGKMIGQVGPGYLRDAALTVLGRAGTGADEVGWLLPHQGNLNMIRQVGGELGVPGDRILVNLDRRGNTSSAGMPSCLSEHVHAGIVQPGDPILGVGIGRGFSWGAMLFTYKTPYPVSARTVETADAAAR